MYVYLCIKTKTVQTNINNTKNDSFMYLYFYNDDKSIWICNLFV